MRKKTLNKYYRGITIFILILLFIFIALSDRTLIKIPAGHVGVLYHFTEGTLTKDVYSEGYKVILPIHTMYIYDVRMQILHQEMDVLSNDGLKIKLTVDTRYQPVRDSAGVIHKKLGINYADVVLKPEIASSVRNIISKYDPEELYTEDRAKIEDEITKNCIAEFGQEDIIVNDIMIRNIELPQLVASAIESKIQQEQKNLEYEYILQKEQKEAQRKQIEANGIKNFVATSGISIITWKGIEATVELAKSNNAKVVVIGNDSKSLPIILNAESPAKNN